jgi:hypothetical protein
VKASANELRSACGAGRNPNVRSLGGRRIAAIFHRLWRVQESAIRFATAYDGLLNGFALSIPSFNIHLDSPNC